MDVCATQCNGRPAREFQAAAFAVLSSKMRRTCRDCEQQHSYMDFAAQHAVSAEELPAKSDRRLL